MRGLAAVMMGTALLAPAMAWAQAPAAAPAAPRPDQLAFRAIYKELVETNTELSIGNCTEAAEKMAGRLKAAGYPDADVALFTAPDHPKEGGMTAILHGSDPKAGAVLLLGHLDVVEAKRSDWTRDPFTLIEEGGYFYGRGTADMKSLDAIWVDTFIRLKQAKAPPKRTLKLALTCGEETNEAFNGANWLAANKPELVRADFGLNEGGGGRLTPDGKRDVLSVQVGEKASQSYQLVVTNPGGHSSRPRPDNAIYQLADALEKIRAYTFPVKISDTTRVGFEQRAARGDAAGNALKTLLSNPNDAEAAKVAASDVNINSILHTNCVATWLEAGHAFNALPQRAMAVVNCRIFPGETWQETRDTLAKVVNDPGVTITPMNSAKPVAIPPPLDPKVIEPMKAVAAKHFPGVPLLPAMSSGASDAVYFGQIKMAIYGVPGVFGDPDGGGVHGLNERLRVQSLYDGRDYLFDLVKTYVGAK